MNKNYNPSEIEQIYYQKWLKTGCFNKKKDECAYTVMLPPPNITGTLHMGHAFQQTLIDLLIRYYRMKSYDVRLQTGTDHAGIATQMVVERNLNSLGVSKDSLGRSSFINKIFQWKEESSDIIFNQMKRLGVSANWNLSRFTMDREFSKSVKECFIKLFDDGLIYRGKKLVNWDPKLLTAVSDLEVLSEERKGKLYYLKYYLDDYHKKDFASYISIATTRPETIFGDVAIAVNPEDERYKGFIGKKVKVPLIGRKINIIGDASISKDFGSGCVKITPAHDFNDYDIGIRHKLPLINIFDEKARLNSKVPIEYRGLDRFEARVNILKFLKENNFLLKEKDHSVKLSIGDRSGVILEPYLTEQWFLKTDQMGEMALKAVQEKKINFYPDQWKNTYYSWIKDLKDWCISRQLWWGHRIPAWYDKNGRVYVGNSEEDVREKYSLPSDILLKQDEDVFDTWFSSALWPFASLGWPNQNKKEDIRKYYPSNVLVTGFDIIFFWVARMIMFGMYFLKKVPFKDILVTGLILDSEGNKMSKSKGNVINPINLIDGISLNRLLDQQTKNLMQPGMKSKVISSLKKYFPQGIDSYGADALRFTFISLFSSSRGIVFDINRVRGYRNFCNKLWNASRFTLMYCEIPNKETSLPDDNNNDQFVRIFDMWILHQLNQLLLRTHKNIKKYRFDFLSKDVYEFVWNEYCDWYIEFSKTILQNVFFTLSNKNKIKNSLINVLYLILKISHPIIPFITEKIYQDIKKYFDVKSDFIINDSFPNFDNKYNNFGAVLEVEWLKKFITIVRKMKSDLFIKSKTPIDIYLKIFQDIDKQKDFLLKHIARPMLCIDKIYIYRDSKEIPPSSIGVVSKDLEIHIPLIYSDFSSEKNRLNKMISKIKLDIAYLEKKLSNNNFLKKASFDVIKKDKERLSEYRLNYVKMKGKLNMVKKVIVY